MGSCARGKLTKVVLHMVGVHALAVSVMSCVCAGVTAKQVAGHTDLRPQLPEFEVATVKPSDPKGHGALGIFTYPGGIVKVGGMTVQDILVVVFGVQSSQIAGGPAWTRLSRYDIFAKPPVSSMSSKSIPASVKAPPIDEQRRMLEALLIDRMQLTFHHVQRTSELYLLKKGNGLLKLSPPKDRNVFPWVGSHRQGMLNGDGMVGMNISMPLLAERLSAVLEHPVMDKTGLAGNFDFDVSYPLEDDGSDITPSLITSLKDIGLRLEAIKGSVDVVAIDHIERPSLN